jgi:hypothetical protein
MITALEMFKRGLKPAYYDTVGSSSGPSLLKEIADLKARYPYVSRFHEVKNGEKVEVLFFFQTEAQKESFLQDIEGLWFEHSEFHVALGRALGFPPLALQYWVDRGANLSLEQYHVSLWWWGSKCASHMKDLIRNVEWIWDNVPVTGDLIHIPIEVRYAKPTEETVRGARQSSQSLRFSIGYKNRKQLQEVKKQVVEYWSQWYGKLD